jgi:transitional endoplasmic reticulum ATPase
LWPGRFDRLLEIPLPDNEARKEILKIHTSKKPLDKTVSLDKLVELTKGYSGADIAALVNAAAMSAIKEYVAVNRDEQTKQSNEFEHGAKSGKVPLEISFGKFEASLKKIKRKGRVQNTSLA